MALRIYGKATLWVILASATLTVMGGAILAPVLTLMREGLGVDASSARLLITTHSIFIALFSPLFGILIDKIGTRKPFVLGLALFGLAGGAGLFINDYALLLVSRAFLGIGAAAIFTSITVLIFDLYEQGVRRDKIMGYRASSQSIGGLIWPLLGGFLGSFSWHYPFAIYLIGVLLAVLAFLFIPETLRKSSTTNDAKGTSVFSIFRDNPILFTPYFLGFLGSVFLYALVIFLPEVLNQFGVTNPLHIGFFIAGMSLVAGLVALMYGRIKAKLSYKGIVSIAITLWGIGFAILSQASAIWLVGLSVAIIGVSQGIFMPTVALWVGQLVPAAFRGRITSYIGTFGLVGQFLSPIMLSPIASSLGLNYVFLVISVVCALMLVLFLVLLRQHGFLETSGDK
jgi:ACDE family multidrug resistance protein